MRTKSVVLLIVALGCGLVASIGITKVMANRHAKPVAMHGETQAIFVAAKEVPLGEPLSVRAVRMEQWPKGKVPPGAVSRIEDIDGRRTRAKLYPGEPILENKLFAKGASQQGYAALIPKGYRLISVRVDKESGSGLILPGDRVDVLVHVIRNPSKGVPETSTRTILQDVRVFAVNDVVETHDQNDKSISAQTISLLVTPEDAETVMLAAELGKIRLIMRSPEDEDLARVNGSTPSKLFSGTKAGDRQNERLLKSSAGTGQDPNFLAMLKQMQSASSNPKAMHRMRIMLGPEVMDVVLQQEGKPSDSKSDSSVWTQHAQPPDIGSQMTMDTLPPDPIGAE
jgi:pilus assembly protein CpaB